MPNTWLFGRSGRMLRAKTVTFLRTESGLSALSSSWTYVAGQKGVGAEEATLKNKKAGGGLGGRVHR